MQIGGLCRAMTIQDVARLMYLHWHAVRDLDKIYMREQLRVAGDPKPRIIGIDEISIKKGHSYRIVVSDLVARRAIWFGGTGRTEADMDLFYAFLGKQNSRKIRLAVMDRPPNFSCPKSATESGNVSRQFRKCSRNSAQFRGTLEASHRAGKASGGVGSDPCKGDGLTSERGKF